MCALGEIVAAIALDVATRLILGSLLYLQWLSAPEGRAPLEIVMCKRRSDESIHDLLVALLPGNVD